MKKIGMLVTDEMMKLVVVESQTDTITEKIPVPSEEQLEQLDKMLKLSRLYFNVFRQESVRVANTFGGEE